MRPEVSPNMYPWAFFGHCSSACPGSVPRPFQRGAMEQFGDHFPTFVRDTRRAAREHVFGNPSNTTLDACLLTSISIECWRPSSRSDTPFRLNVKGPAAVGGVCWVGLGVALHRMSLEGFVHGRPHRWMFARRGGVRACSWTIVRFFCRRCWPRSLFSKSWRDPGDRRDLERRLQSGPMQKGVSPKSEARAACPDLVDRSSGRPWTMPVIGTLWIATPLSSSEPAGVDHQEGLSSRACCSHSRKCSPAPNTRILRSARRSRARARAPRDCSARGSPAGDQLAPEICPSECGIPRSAAGFGHPDAPHISYCCSFRKVRRHRSLSLFLV